MTDTTIAEIGAALPFLEGQLPHQAEDVRIEAEPLASLVQVAAWPGTKDEASNAVKTALDLDALPSQRRVVESGAHRVLDAGPGKLLISSSEAGLPARLNEAVGIELGVVTDLSHTRVCLTVTGDRAPWVLSKGVAIDLDPQVFEEGCCALTAVGAIGVPLARLADRDGKPAFALYPYSSFARSLADWLAEASLADALPVGGTFL